MKNNNKRTTLINSIVLSLCPIVACLLRVFVDCESLSNVSLLSSTWNDEIFYFQQVASCTKGIWPIGYFGYNESQALYLSFGAWNPAILLPWILWSKLFGWNYWSPIVSNIVIVSLSFFAFSMMVKPNLKRVLCLIFVLALFFPFSRFLLSSMPDMIIVSGLILIVGLFISSTEKYTKWKLVSLYLILLLLTLMRPYLIMLFLLPLYLTVKNQKTNWFIPCIIALFTVITYYFSNKYLTSPYFGEVFSIDWLRYFLNEGMTVGITQTLSLLNNQWAVLWYMLFHNIPNGFASCTYYRFFFILLILCIIELIVSLTKKNWSISYLLSSLILMHFAIIGAILLMYNLYDGSKHLLLYIFVDLFVLILIGYSWSVQTITMISLCIYSFLIAGNNSTEFDIPYKTNSYNKITEFSELISDNLQVTSSKLSWDNDVIVVYMDYLSEDATQEEKEIFWQYTYALPQGFALNYCTRDYLSDNINNLKSKYIMVTTGSSIEAKLQNIGISEIQGNDYVTLYQLR